MARKPRPIDPTEGPLQAFAHDLRLVREAAGNPTYRALATTAGFGATTLSDAAGGVRQPSLEVTLAYVGACGGDVAAWEQRWRELNRTLQEQRASAKHPGGDGAVANGAAPEAGSAGTPAPQAPATRPPAAAEAPAPQAPATENPAAETAAPEAPAVESAAPGTPSAETAAPEVPSAETAAPGAPAADPTAPEPSAAEAAAPTAAGPVAASADAPAAAGPDQVDGARATGLRAVDAPESTGDPGHPGAPGRSIWRRPVTIAAVAVIALVAALLVARPPIMQDAKAQETTPTACGPVPPAAAKGITATDFVGATYGDGAHVRTGASRNSPTIRTIPAGCQLHFTGYCLGDVIYDSHGGSVDMRWFELYGGGVIASAIIHGNPPDAMAPSHCPADRPMPDRISLGMVRNANTSDTVQLRADGTNLGIVGFAARYVTPSPSPSPATGATGHPTPTPSAAPAAPTWHHLDLINSDTGTFDFPWRLGPLTGTADQPGSPGSAIAVVAAACLGGDGPTDVTDVRLLPAITDTTSGQPAPNPPQQVKLSAAEQVTAAQAACRYPDSTG
ncbi:hypothetical protein [Kitasatospora humi]|uniref:hypothetical protein n=1 Tax=Kitasatospora humi TaxID=2893891 RepID=UPI0024C017F3|nr:hypothetical protein [Kitasatospora humi]